MIMPVVVGPVGFRLMCIVRALALGPGARLRLVYATILDWGSTYMIGRRESAHLESIYAVEVEESLDDRELANGVC